MFGCLKSLQAHLRHLVWQVQRVEQGDFSQRVEFMGDFSSAFNSMIQHLDSTRKTLKKNEEAMQALATSLRIEMDSRNKTLKALKESELRFKYLAGHDHLTGILNRKAFMDRAQMEFESAAIHKIPCCMAIMDIDHFKKFNDNYGHLAGDEILRHVVQVVDQTLRKSDFMGRYGGEEFVFFFYNSDIENTFCILERIREAIMSSPMEWNGKMLYVTASFGVCEMLEKNLLDERQIETILNLADNALYEAKKTGRNRVVCHGVPEIFPEPETLDFTLVPSVIQTKESARSLNL